MRRIANVEWKQTTEESRKHTRASKKSNEIFAGILTSIRTGIVVYTPLDIDDMTSKRSKLRTSVKRALKCAQRGDLKDRLVGMAVNISHSLSDWRGNEKDNSGNVKSIKCQEHRNNAAACRKFHLCLRAPERGTTHVCPKCFARTLDGIYNGVGGGFRECVCTNVKCG